MKISAIVSDYDGTLCPTTSIYSNNHIPQDLYNILLDISKHIPVCIITSKEFSFIERNIDFAKIVSCLMGLETFIFSPKDHKPDSGNFQEQNESYFRSNFDNMIKKNSIIKYFIKQNDKIVKNSLLLEKLSLVISENFNGIKIFKKYTYRDKQLAGFSIDYRHLLNWENFKTLIEPRILDKITEFQKIHTSRTDNFYIQSYLTHPFLDIYSIYHNKGEIMAEMSSILQLTNKKILYLGDSENDNSAFKTADLSINIKSDERIDTKLDSNYTLEFNELGNFLIKLRNENFNFNSMSI
jgi:HAD superfamily hydrolase (TIGR01484 family)